MHAFGRLLLTVVAAAAAAIAQAGSMRFELPELVGQHELTTLTYSLPAGYAATTKSVEMPFDVRSVHSARLVVVGTATAGRIRGDGVIRAAEEAEFLPRVMAAPYFYSGNHIGFFNMDLPLSAIRIDQSYAEPFVPPTTPLPNPDAGPSEPKFDVTLTMYPDWIAMRSVPFLTEPDPAEFWSELAGLTIVAPTVAQITEAYLILEGPGVVPEPTTGILAALAFVVPLMSRARVRAA